MQINEQIYIEYFNSFLSLSINCRERNLLEDSNIKWDIALSTECRNILKPPVHHVGMMEELERRCRT